MILKDKIVYLLDSLGPHGIRQKLLLAEYPWEKLNAAHMKLFKVLERGSIDEKVPEDVKKRRDAIWFQEWASSLAEAKNHDKGMASNHSKDCVIIPDDGIVIPESSNAASSSSAPPGTAPPGAKSSSKSSSDIITMPPLPPPNVVDEFDIQDYIDEFKKSTPRYQLQLYYPLPKNKMNRFTTITISQCGGLQQTQELAKVSR
jgi:hypothetical protein